MKGFFNTFFYQPLFNLLIFFYQYLSFGDLGVAIIFFTVFIRLLLFPLFYKGAKDQAIMQHLAPKIKEIQRTHKDDRERQARALMDLYREHRVNPLSGFLLILVQLPILIALYRVFLNGFEVAALGSLYSFVPRPESLDHYFLGMIDLGKRNIIVVILAAITQYFQGKISIINTNSNQKELTPVEAMGRQMVYLGPILTIVFLYFFNLPSAIALYWLTTSLFSIIQQMIINRKINQAQQIDSVKV